MQKTIYIYQSHICQIGGVETFLYNWCLNLRNYYDITILYCDGDRIQINRLKRLVKLEKYQEEKEYVCDIFIRNSVWGKIPKNVISKDNRYLEMRHANYKYLLERGLLYQQYHKYDKTNEVIGCGYFVSKMSDEVLKDNPVTIQNILAPKHQTNKVLHLISCTRIDANKGWKRMIKLADMLRNAGIKFDWKIFTNSKQNCNYEEIHFYTQRFDIWDYLNDADYTVLLSDCEGLPYTVQESLQYKTPCIVTDVEGCTELIKDGINGYVVPLDMNFDVNKLLKIPKLEEYDNHALEKWLDYLGDSKYEEKEIEEMKQYKVKSRINFTDLEANKKRTIGEEFICHKERYEYLLKHNAIELIQEIEEKKTAKPIKEEFKIEDTKKKTTKKKNTKKK